MSMSCIHIGLICITLLRLLTSQKYLIQLLTVEKVVYSSHGMNCMFVFLFFLITYLVVVYLYCIYSRVRNSKYLFLQVTSTVFIRTDAKVS